jgi:hypothetical protein
MYIQIKPLAFGHQEALSAEILEEVSNVSIRDSAVLIAVDLDNKY